jgi:hypothetical protein
MGRTYGDNTVTGPARVATGVSGASQGLEWLWQHVRDVPKPHILDCGPVSPATVQVLLRRGAKFYAADLMTPLLKGEARFWDRGRKTPTFLPLEFLAQLPHIPAGSLTAILSWNLFDLAPHESLPAIVTRLFSLLEPMGVLFCVLREPHAKAGVENRWWLETLTSFRREADSKKPFPYPAITNREIERLLPAASIKTFLTRSGQREILAMRRE